MFLKVTQDADICKLFTVAVSTQGEEERPLQGHEAPHTGQVEALGVSEGLLVVDGNRKKSDECHHSQDREETPNEEEKLEAFQPGPPVVLQVHDVGDQGPKCEHT